MHYTLCITTLLCSLFSSPGGGEPDDLRHVNTFIVDPRLCLWINPLLVVNIGVWLLGVRGGVVLLLGLMVLNDGMARRGGSLLLVFWGRRTLDAAYYYHH